MAESTGSALSPARLAAMIDHTFLKAFGTPQDIATLCDEALAHRFAAVMVNPYEIAACAQRLAGSGIAVGTVIGFPLGQNTSAVKAFEMRDALERGAAELDMVLNVRALRAGALDVVRAEFAALARACREGNAVSKVILETCYLADDEKRAACRLAAEAGLDFVKTSTGFGTGGATVEDVRLMREAAGPAVAVKASGGIRDLDAALVMVAAGATRLGTSSGVALVEALRRRGGA